MNQRLHQITMNSEPLRRGLVRFTAVFAAMIAITARADDRPNMVLILADDLAWSDLACYGHPWHQTPHLDALAGQGMKFTDGYAPAPICSASRAGILTGKTPARLKFEFVTKNGPGRQVLDAPVPLRTPPFTLDLPLEEITIAEALGDLGYKTAFFGKWHLNAHHEGYLGWSPRFGPRQQGFRVAEEDFGSHPYAWRKSVPETIETRGDCGDDSMIDRACRFLASPKSGPFFLMVSQFHVHTPVKTRCRWLLQKYDAMIPHDSPHREQRISYAAFVEELDHRIGELVRAIDRAGLNDQTVVVFTSDNGGHPEFTANGPLRGSKWNLYEGGIRVPFIVRWPGHVPAGSVGSVPVTGCDLLPTFIDIADGTFPSAMTVDGVSLRSLWTRDRSQARPDRLRTGRQVGEDPAVERDLIWHFPYYHPEQGYRVAREPIGVNDFAVSKTKPHSALRRGHHKLLHFHEDQRTELYDLRHDPSERRDLSASETAKTAELLGRLQSRLREMGARFPEKVEG